MQQDTSVWFIFTDKYRTSVYSVQTGGISEVMAAFQNVNSEITGKRGRTGGWVQEEAKKEAEEEEKEEMA